MSDEIHFATALPAPTVESLTKLIKANLLDESVSEFAYDQSGTERVVTSSCEDDSIYRPITALDSAASLSPGGDAKLRHRTQDDD